MFKSAIRLPLQVFTHLSILFVFTQNSNADFQPIQLKASEGGEI